MSPPPAPSLGFAVPLRDIAGRRPCDEGPTPRRVSVRGVSHALDGLLRLPARGFVSPHSHVQGSPFRGFASRAAAAPRRRRSALSSLGAEPLTVSPPPPHLAAPPSGLFSARESVVVTAAINRGIDSIPSWVWPPPGAPSRRRVDAFTSALARPWRALVRTPLRWPSAIVVDEPDILSREMPTCSRFLPAVRLAASDEALRSSSRQPNRAANRFRIQSPCTARATARRASPSVASRISARLRLWTAL